MIALRNSAAVPLKIKNGLLRLLSHAAYLYDHDKPLKIQEFNQQNELSDDQVQIFVKYCSLNFNDVKYLEQGKFPFPHIPGYELSGEVLKVGEDVDNVKEGDRVVAIAPNRCGGFASEILLNQADVWPLPSGISTKDAATLVVGHTTALLAFTEKRPLKENETVLVIAGAGGFGLAAVDIVSSIFKTKIIALADTEGKASLLRDRGAFAAFKNDAKHNYKEIMKATNGEGVDVIYDAVGGTILNTVFKCLKDQKNGSLLTTYNPEEILELKNSNDKADRLLEEVAEKLEYISLTEYRETDHDKYYSIVQQVLQFCEEGLISAHTSKSFHLQQINEAIEYIKGKMCTGKVLINISEEE